MGNDTPVLRCWGDTEEKNAFVCVFVSRGGAGGGHITVLYNTLQKEEIVPPEIIQVSPLDQEKHQSGPKPGCTNRL